MPWVVVNLIEGRSVEMKQKLQESVIKAVSESLEIKASKVHVQLVEMPKENYLEGKDS